MPAFCCYPIFEWVYSDKVLLCSLFHTTLKYLLVLMCNHEYDFYTCRTMKRVLRTGYLFLCVWYHKYKCTGVILFCYLSRTFKNINLFTSFTTNKNSNALNLNFVVVQIKVFILEIHIKSIFSELFLISETGTLNKAIQILFLLYQICKHV